MCVCMRHVPEASAEGDAIASLPLPLPIFTFPLSTKCLSTGVCASSGRSGRKLEHGRDGRVHRRNKPQNAISTISQESALYSSTYTALLKDAHTTNHIKKDADTTEDIKAFLN